MSYSASDLQNDIDGLLAELGYEICDGGQDDADPGDAWTWRFGGGPEHGCLPFDEATEATHAAMKDLTGCVDDILGTGRTVVERWESGDLAQAVRELDGALHMLDPGSHARADPQAKAERRAARLRRLIIEGLSLDDCIEAFGTRSMEDPRIRRAALAQDGQTVLVLDHSVLREDLGVGDEVHALVWLRIGDSTPQG